MSFRRLTPLLALLVLALAAPAAHAFAGPNGDLVYGWSEIDEPDVGPSWLYVEAIRTISPRGGTPTTVTGCSQTLPFQAPDQARTCVLQVFADPAVSRDRAQIAFDHGRSLALVDPDGRNLQGLPAQSADDGEPAFSARGGRLAFSAGTPVGTAGSGMGRGIWIRTLASGATRQLAGNATDPAWSSRNWIAFERDGDVFIVRPGGRGLRRLVRDAVEPVWSPSGRQLAFVRGRSIRILTLRTHRVRRIARGVSATDLAWSPDGRRLAYTIFDGGIETVRTNGSGARELVPGGSNGTSSFLAVGLDWAPRR